MTTAGEVVLAIDTSTATAVVALGDTAGRLLAADRWVAGFRHGEELLAHVDALVRGHGAAVADVGAVVVGTGPGAFTGLRVGVATAKGLAVGLGRPLAAVPSGAALLEAARGMGARGSLVLLLPAGPSELTLVSDTGEGGVTGSIATRRLGSEAWLAPDPGLTVVAVDLAGRAPEEALERGRRAVEGLAGVLVRLGAARLATHGPDDLAAVVPEYVTLPRGIAREEGGIVVGRV